MITAREAANIVFKKYPKTHPRKVVDLDSDRYVVEAPVILDDVDLSVPFYYVTKDGKDCGVFNPMNDLEKFISAGRNGINIE